MIDAFSILGATPLDNMEKLKELFEEKQLFSDSNNDEINLAYSELTNIKKRINHEIYYYSKKTFKKFYEIFNDNDNDEQKLVIEDICSSIIKVGKWFDRNIDYLFNQINKNRENAGFALVGDKTILQENVDEIKSNCISKVTKYFDFIDSNDLVTIFNTLVMQDNYICFFVDDLLAHYENAMKETIDKKKKLCNQKFALIEKNSNTFIANGDIAANFSNNINSFKKAITSWDKIVQPLQINYENRGSEHPASLDFVHDLRNKVIDMCNKSQEDLTSLINKISQDYSAKQSFIKKLVNSVTYIDNLIKILDILIGIFKEIETIAERLKKDKQDFLSLKTDLNNLLNEIDPNYSLRTFLYKQNNIQTSQSKTNSKTTYSRPENNESPGKEELSFVKFIIELIFVIFSIIGFEIGNTFIGISFLIVCVSILLIK
jgi:hypothetical protein